MEMKNIMKNRNSLYHYGVKGMRWDPSKRSHRQSSSDGQGVRVDKRVAYEKYEKIGDKHYSSSAKNAVGGKTPVNYKYSKYKGVGKQVILQILSGKVPLVKTKK